MIFRDTVLLLCNSIRFPVVPFHSFIIADIVYSRRYRAERENSRYNRNFFNDKEKNAEANLRLRSESATENAGGGGGQRGGRVAERKETGRVSNGRIRIKRKIKVNAFRRLCRRWMNGSIAFVINGVSKPFTLGKYQHFSIDYFPLPFPFLFRTTTVSPGYFSRFVLRGW